MFYLLRLKSPPCLQPCCDLTTGPFVTFKMAQINPLDIGNQQHAFKFKNWLGTLGSVAFWKWGVFGKNQKFMKSAYFKSYFLGQFQLQIFATAKPLEIDAWNQVQIILWHVSFCREKVPGENIYPPKRKTYGLFWQSEIWNSPHMIILVFTLWCLI